MCRWRGCAAGHRGLADRSVYVQGLRDTGSVLALVLWPSTAMVRPPTAPHPLQQNHKLKLKHEKLIPKLAHVPSDGLMT